LTILIITIANGYENNPVKNNPVTDRTYPMNLSEDFLCLGGNQLLSLCSCSLIFAIAKAPIMAAVKMDNVNFS
jgi:hypothetical protein